MSPRDEAMLLRTAKRLVYLMSGLVVFALFTLAALVYILFEC